MSGSVGKRFAPLLVVLLLVAWSRESSAAATCEFEAVGPAFGVYDPFSASPLLANGTVTVICTHTGGGNTVINITTSYSIGFGSSYASRYMLSGANRLYYNIYYDGGFTQIRGDGTGGSQAGGATLSVNRGRRTASASSTVYGRIPAGQNAAPGMYADTITVTVMY